jgi:hypothetical protein
MFDQIVFDQAFFFVVLLYGVAVYFDGHQASHLMYMRAREEYLNPSIHFTLVLYSASHMPWLVLIWMWYKTTWHFPLAVMLFAQLVRLALVSIQDKLNLTKDAAVISLLGIIVIPICLISIIFIFNNI